MNEETSNEVVEETVTEEVTPETTNDEPSSQQEEPQSEEQEQPQIYAGKYKSPEELEKAYLKATAEATRMAQEIAKSKKPQLSPDKQEILNELKSLGVMTKEEFMQEQAVETQKAKDEREIQELQLSDNQVNALRRYASHRDNLSKSMAECWDELTGSIGGKVISRKTTLKPKKGLDGGFKEKTSAELARLPKDEYDKYWADYAANKANQ